MPEIPGVDPAGWNPRYLNYCKPLRPDERALLDEPHGCMIPFMLWNNQQWRRFLALRRDVDPEVKTDRDHADFDAWLETQPGAPLDWLSRPS